MPVTQGSVVAGPQQPVEGYDINGNRLPDTPGPSRPGGFVGDVYRGGKDFVSGLYGSTQVPHAPGYHYGGPSEGELGVDQARTDQRGLAYQPDLAGATRLTAGRQEGLNQQYEEALHGRGPSVAAEQQAQGLAAANRQALGVAASARGGAGAQLAASQAAIRQGAESSQTAVGRAAELRASEMATARGQYGGLLGQQRQQAVGEQMGLAELAMKNRQTNDQRYQALLAARTAAENTRAGTYGAKTAADAQANAANAGTKKGIIGGVVGGLSSVLCCSPGTLILTPTGERRIADLSVGDIIYSTLRGERVEAPVASVTRRRVHVHSVARVHLDSGRMLLVSASHPTADGRTLGDLQAGDVLDGAIVTRTAIVPYDHSHTYDVRPDTPDGHYWAEGALIGSTIPAGSAPALGAVSAEVAP